MGALSSIRFSIRSFIIRNLQVAYYRGPIRNATYWLRMFYVSEWRSCRNLRQLSCDKADWKLMSTDESRWDENAGLQAGCDKLPVTTRSRRNRKGDRQ